MIGPRVTNQINLMDSVGTLETVSYLRLALYPRAILKFSPPSRLDYKASHRPQTEVYYFQVREFFENVI